MRQSRADIVRRLCDSMEHLYTERECMNIARRVAAWAEGVDLIKYLTEPHAEVEIDNIEQIAERLAAATPLQYITGEEEFCGLQFKVREGVLIPRPETEELVLWAEQQAKNFSAPRILDLCTGSGCIAISLAHRVPTAQTTAIDLSDEALAVARQNNSLHGNSVTIFKDDVLGELSSIEGRQFDIIVSNPPYIPISERVQMRQNVTDHEPAMALFVEDDNPLKFYRAIAAKAKTALADGGFLLFEIHENLASATAEMLREEGFANIEIRRDFLDKPRMICCQPKRE